MRLADTVFSNESRRKSSYSGSQTNCVEVARTARDVGIRDTKHRDGGALHVPASAWHAFTTRA